MKLFYVLTTNVGMLVVVRAVVVGIGIDYYSESTEQVFAAKDWTRNHSVTRIPQRKSVTEKIFALSSHLEADYELPVAVPARDLVPNCAAHRLFVGREANVALCEHH